MVFSKRLPLSSLITLCHSLRHYLSAGLTLREVFRQQAKKGPLAVRPVAERISQELNKGEDLESALRSEQRAFPPLFLALASVGEESGALPEVFTELEKYYDLQQKLRRQFLGQIAWPVFQLCGAIVVITLLILVMGFIAEMNPTNKPFDPLGLGLLGPSGAITFLTIVFLILAALAAVYFGGKHLLRQKGAVDGFLLRLPVLGPTLRALALTRFCLGLRLTLETGMPITKALELSLRATDNDAFVAQTQQLYALIGEALQTSGRGAAGSGTGAMPSNPLIAGFADVQDCAEEIAKKNADSAFALAEKIAKAQTLQDILTLQTQFAQEQMQAYAAQTEGLRLLIDKAFRKP